MYFYDQEGLHHTANFTARSVLLPIHEENKGGGGGGAGHHNTRFIQRELYFNQFMNKIKGGHQTSFTQQEVYFCQFIKKINGGCSEGVPLSR